MLKIRQEQVEALAAATMTGVLKERLFELREEGFDVQEDAGTGEILVRDKAGGVTRAESLGLRTRVTSAEGLVTEFEQYPYGRVKRIVDSAGREVRFERDAEGLLQAIDRGPGGGRFGFQLSKDWKPLRIEYPDGTVSSTEYTPDGRPALVTNRDGTKIGYKYTHDSNLAAIVDPQGRRTQFTHSGPGDSRLIAYPNGDRHEYIDDVERGTAQFVVNGETNAEYQSDGNSVEAKYQDGSVERFTYEQGQLVEAVNQYATVKFTYDADGRLLSEETNGAVVQYRRNAVGALVGVMTPQGDSLTYIRDRDQRLTEIADWTDRRYRVQLPVAGFPAQIDYPNGVRVKTTLNAMGLPAGWSVSRPGSVTLDAATWVHDTCDRLVSADRLGVRRKYRYDDASRLRDVQCSNAEFNESFDLDSCGNSRADSAHDPANRLLRQGQRTFSYDALGNQVGEKRGLRSRRYQYDGGGRLTKVHQGNQSVEYIYDPLGRRIAKKVGGVTTRFVWAGTQLLSETVDDGKTVVRRDYLFCPEFLTPLAFREGTSVFCIHSGRLQEPLCVTDDAGSVVWQADYQAFGKARLVVDRVHLPFRLPGQYHDQETGLHYSVARYYDSTLGRFLSLDPARSPGGSCNYYLYCDGDPLNRVDPTGEIGGFLTAVAIGAAAGLVVGAIIGASVEAYNQGGWPTDWGKVGKQALIGGAVGLVGGAVAGAIGFGVAGALGAMLAGGVGSGIEYCTEAGLRGEEVKPLTLVGSVVLGGVIGAFTAGVGGVVAARSARTAGMKKVLQELEEAAAAKLAKEAEEAAAAKLAKEAEEAAAAKAKAAQEAADEASKNALRPKPNKNDLNERQNIHKKGTNEYKTRSEGPKGKPTAWKDNSTADDLTLEAYEKGKVTQSHDDGSPAEIQWETEPKRVVGENGETRITVKVAKTGKEIGKDVVGKGKSKPNKGARLHGYPSGPKDPNIK